MTANTLLNSQEVRKLPAGALFKAIFVISYISQKSDKNGKPYYDVTATDGLGTVEAKVWSDAQWLDKSEAAPQSDDDKLPPERIVQLTGRTVGVNGKVAEYRGLLQFNFNKITLLNQENIRPRATCRILRYRPASLRLASRRSSANVRARRGSSCASSSAATAGRASATGPPAVSHHHAYANGLLEHTVSVAACAKAMAESMAASGYDVDKETVIAGALLHDIGKLESYRMAPVPEITVEGALLDHVAQGYLRFSELAAQFGLSEKLRTHLSHILLSHHGQREFGSPVVPATPEALIVSSADELDFRMFC